MNINPEKLKLSKWQAVVPKNKEKHFLVIQVKRDDELRVTHCVIEALLTKKQQEIPWQQLLNKEVWKQGW